MGYARYIGRIGALAVTLGVGIAVANTPGIAYAETPDSSTSTDTNSSPTSPTDGSTGNQAPPANPESPSDTDEESLDADDPVDDDLEVDGEEEAEEALEAEGAEGAEDETTNGGEQEVLPPGGGEQEVLPPAGGEWEPPAETLRTQDGDSHRQSVDGDSHLADLSGGSRTLDVSAFSELPNKAASKIEDGQSAQANRQQLQTLGAFISDPADAGSFASTFATTSVPITTTSARPQPAWVTVVTDFVNAVLRSMQNPADGSPLQLPTLTAALFLVRNELERSLVPRTTNVATQQSVSQLEDPPEANIVATDTHVLVIAVDGANLSRILADPENENFRALMLDSTTGPSSIVGHTTVSNPSWTAILTGNWGEETGVINNVFTPWTYDEYPTVFNQIEQLEQGDEDIVTMAIANWDVINAISAAGSDPADHNIYVGHEEDDLYWEESDDYVADLTIDAISGADGPDANFIVSYFVGVDENGHEYGGGSDEYRDSLRNMDDNLGDIMQAIDESGEEWTVIVVTDHGHTTQKGFGHGFQTPDETETFVIAHGSDFTPGYINTQYEIVDTTPTVVRLFGGEPRSNANGTPLMDLDAYSVPPEGDLFTALQAEIAKNQSPDPLTNMRLSMRTIFATVPYFLRLYGDNITQSLPSPLVGPVQQTLDAVYVGINIPVQIVAKLTGVEGASTFPRVAPPRPDFQPVYPPTLLLVRCGDTASSAAGSCGDAIVA